MFKGWRRGSHTKQASAIPQPAEISPPTITNRAKRSSRTPSPDVSSSKLLQEDPPAIHPPKELQVPALPSSSLRDVDASSHGEVVKGPASGEELQRTVWAQRDAVTDLQHTIQMQHAQLRQQRCIIEWLQGVLRAGRVPTPSDGPDLGQVASPAENSDWIKEIEEGSYDSLEEMSSTLTSQILERLHLAEDRYRLQEEEIRLLELALEERESQVVRLEHRILYDRRLITAMRTELSAVRRKLRDQRHSTANMEVEIERFKVEKRELSRMMSHSGQQDDLYSERSSSPDRPLSTSHHLYARSSHEAGTPDPWGSNLSTPTHAFGAGLVGGHNGRLGGGALATPSGEHTGSGGYVAPSGGNGLLGLLAELEAARSVAQREAERRVKAENTLEQVRALLRDKNRMLHDKPAVGGIEGEVEQEALQEAEAVVPPRVEEEEEGPGELALVVLKEDLASLRSLNPELQAMWEASRTEFKVRGRSYMVDSVKVDSQPPLFELLHMELFDVATDMPTPLPRADHVVDLLKEVDSVYNRVLGSSQPPFLLVVNFQVPGSPPCSVVVTFALNPSYKATLDAEIAWLRERDTASGEGSGEPPHLFSPRVSDPSPFLTEEEETRATTLRLLAYFLLSDDKHKTDRFKLIPSVVDGPWIIRQAVGASPVIIGKKITPRYFEGPGYLEVAFDIGSSRTAAHIVSMMRSHAKNLVVDLAVVLQGENSAELPERLLGGVRFANVDFALAEKLSSRLFPPPRITAHLSDLQAVASPDSSVA